MLSAPKCLCSAAHHCFLVAVAEAMAHLLIDRAVIQSLLSQRSLNSTAEKTVCLFVRLCSPDTAAEAVAMICTTITLVIDQLNQTTATHWAISLSACSGALMLTVRIIEHCERRSVSCRHWSSQVSQWKRPVSAHSFDQLLSEITVVSQTQILIEPINLVIVSLFRFSFFCKRLNEWLNDKYKLSNFYIKNTIKNFNTKIKNIIW